MVLVTWPRWTQVSGPRLSLPAGTLLQMLLVSGRGHLVHLFAPWLQVGKPEFQAHRLPPRPLVQALPARGPPCLRLLSSCSSPGPAPVGRPIPWDSGRTVTQREGLWSQTRGSAWHSLPPVAWSHFVLESQFLQTEQECVWGCGRNWACRVRRALHTGSQRSVTRVCGDRSVFRDTGQFEGPTQLHCDLLSG